MERRADVLPVVGEGGLDVLLGGDEDGGVLRGEVEEGMEAVDREQLGDVRAVLGVFQRGDLGQLAVLGRELGGRRDLDDVRVAEAARREVGGLGAELDRLVGADRAQADARAIVERCLDRVGLDVEVVGGGRAGRRRGW